MVCRLSLLEEGGFELPVPRAIQARLRAKIVASATCRCRLSAAAVVGHQLRRKAKSRNRTLIACGTGSSNPSPSSGESTNFLFLSRRRPFNTSGGAWADGTAGTRDVVEVSADVREEPAGRMHRRTAKP